MKSRTTIQKAGLVMMFRMFPRTGGIPGLVVRGTAQGVKGCQEQAACAQDFEQARIPGRAHEGFGHQRGGDEGQVRRQFVDSKSLAPMGSRRHFGDGHHARGHVQARSCAHEKHPDGEAAEAVAFRQAHESQADTRHGCDNGPLVSQAAGHEARAKHREAVST